MPDAHWSPVDLVKCTACGPYCRRRSSARCARPRAAPSATAWCVHGSNRHSRRGPTSTHGFGLPVATPADPARRATNYGIRDLESGWNAIYRENAERDSEEQGLEDRHPFYDRRVIEFAAALPDDQRWRGTTTRYVVRRGLADVLSPAARSRTTRAEGAIRVADAVRSMHALGLFDRMALADVGWIKPGAVRGLYEDMVRRLDQGALAYGEHAYPLWIIGGTEAWFRNTFGYNPVTGGTSR